MVARVLVHERSDAKRSDALHESLDQALVGLVLAIEDPVLTAWAATTLYEASVRDAKLAGQEMNRRLRDVARELALLLPPGSTILAETAATLKALGCPADESWYPFDGACERLADAGPSWGYETAFPQVQRPGGVLTWHGVKAGSAEAALFAYERLRSLARWRRGKPCGEPLYQAVKEPERTPVADSITTRHRRLFDLVVVDEGHLYKNAGSAQTAAAMRIAQMGLPILIGTGTWTGGYAEDYFNWLWTLDSRFREEFARDERARFVECYGFLRFQVRYIDKDRQWPVAYGTVSDRVEKQVRLKGNAPGVQPTLFLRHVLPKAAVLLLQDVKADMPPCTEFVEEVQPTVAMASRLDALTKALKKQIKADKKDDLLRGKLWGAMAEIVSYLDLCTDDVGNAEGGTYAIRYPNSHDLGCFAGQLVATEPQLSADTILPKEQWMLDQLRAQLARGRRCLVLGHHVRLLPRWVRLIRTHLGVEVAHLDNRVSAAKLDREIRKARRARRPHPRGEPPAGADRAQLPEGLPDAALARESPLRRDPLRPGARPRGSPRADAAGGAVSRGLRLPAAARRTQAPLPQARRAHRQPGARRLGRPLPGGRGRRQRLRPVQRRQAPRQHPRRRHRGARSGATA